MVEINPLQSVVRFKSFVVGTQQTEQDRFSASRQNTKMILIYQKHFKMSEQTQIISKISKIVYQRKE